MTAERYYVRRPTGKVFGPFDKNAIQLMLKSNKLDTNAEVSRDKQTWQALADVADFAQFARPAGKPGGTVMGMAAVTMDDLPRPVKRSGAELPRPVGGAELPRPTNGAELPRPTSGAELPRPTSGAELPRSTSSAELPRPTSGAELPRSTSSAEFPRSAGHSDLPRPAQVSGLPLPMRGELPRSVGVDLPRPVGQGGLPRPATTQLPTPSRTQLPVPSGPQALTTRQQEEEDLFGIPMLSAEEEDLFGAPALSAEEEDLFGAPVLSEAQESPFMGNSPPGTDEEDLFGGGTPYAQESIDDLFGAPPEPAKSEVLFGSPSPSRQDPSRQDAPLHEDLFSGNSQSDALQVDDLFGPDDGHFEGSEALYGGNDDDDDFLGGAQGFSFLEDSGQDSPADQPAPRDEWDDELLGGTPSVATHGDTSWDDDLLTGNAPPAQSHYSAPPASQPRRIDLDHAPPPRQMSSPGPVSQPMASTGIPVASPPPPAPANTGEPKAAHVVDSDQKRSKMVMIGLPILAVLIIAVGALAVQRFMGDDTTQSGPVAEQVKVFNLSYDELKAPNYAVVQQKVVQSKKASMDESTQGRLLLAYAVMSDLHHDQDMIKSGQQLAASLAGAQGDDAKLGRGAQLIAESKHSEGRELLEPLRDKPGPIGSFAQLFLGIEAAHRLDAQRKVVPPVPTRDSAQPPPTQPTPTQEPQEPQKQADPQPLAEEAPVPKTDLILSLEAEVKQAFEGASTFTPTLAMHYLGGVQERSGDLKTAAKTYRQGLEDNKDFVSSNVSLARVLYHQGELNETIKFLDRVNNDLVQYAHPLEKAEALHYAGQVYSARSQHKEAIDFFTRALANDPSRSDTLRALAEEYERAQQYKEALTFFQTNKTLGQSDPDVMLGIVRAHIGLKEWPQAIAQLEVGEKKFPTDARFPYYLGELNRRRGAFFEAQKSLASAVEIDPSLLMAHAMLAQLAWRTDQDAERGDKHIQEIVSRPEKIDARVATEVAEFYRISNNYELAKLWYNAAIARDPNYWSARLPLARLLLEQGETKNALTLLERSRNEGVTDIKLSAYLADAYRQSKLYDKAIDEINKVIEKVPSKDTTQRAEYIFIRGRIYFDRSNFDTALEDFNQAYTLNTNFYDANFYVGRTKLAQGDTATAIKIFRSVLDYMPNNGEYRFAMGEALQREERLSQALNEYRKVTEVDPGYSVRNPSVYITRGRLLSQLGYSREGRKDIQEALILAPEMVEALIAMGEVDFRDQRYEESIKNLSKALVKEPRHADAQYKLGMAHIYLEQLREGTRHLELAVKYDYPNPDVYRTIGYVYKQLGDRGAALNAFRAFLQESLTTEQPLGTTKEVRRQVEELGG